MKRIKSVNILGVKYKIKYKDIANKEGQNYAGYCINHTSTIVIDTHLSPQIEKSAIVHEIVEAWNNRLELELEHHKITQLETAIFQLLQDNSDLIKYLTKK